MPDQERGVRFLHTLNHLDQKAGVRCLRCPGYRVTYQADCVCCGREVAYQDPNPGHSAKPSATVKPELVEAAMPNPATQPAPAAESQAFKSPRTCKGRQSTKPSPTSILRNVSSFLRPSAARESEIGSNRALLPAAGSRHSVRILQQSTHDAARLSSARRGTRGRPTVRVGAHQDFRGVRTRRGVKGFLVEIRPPKWKKTIWLGTYNTDVEAAGAFDAGVFYTNKPNTKYNFRALEAAFPPLPSHLSLDRPDNMDEIKYFVQRQAKLAAAAARRMCNNYTSGATHPHHQELQEVAKVSDVNSTSTSESCLTDGSVSRTDLPTTPDAEYDGGFLDAIPMDLDYLQGGLPAVDAEAAENWIAEYTNYWNTQPAEGPMN